MHPPPTYSQTDLLSCDKGTRHRKELKTKLLWKPKSAVSLDRDFCITLKRSLFFPFGNIYIYPVIVVFTSEATLQIKMFVCLSAKTKSHIPLWKYVLLIVITFIKKVYNSNVNFHIYLILIILSFPQISKSKYIRLKPVLLAPRGRSITIFGLTFLIHLSNMLKFSIDFCHFNIILVIK